MTATSAADTRWGYAVVDADRVVRYATLDPAYLRNAFEVATVAGAVR